MKEIDLVLRFGADVLKRVTHFFKVLLVKMLLSYLQTEFMFIKCCINKAQLRSTS